MKEILFFNAPPNSGKDTCADYFVENYGAVHLRFKDKLYKLTALINDIPVEEFIKMANDRNIKDSDIKLGINGKNPRNLLIETSEEVIKPIYGKDYFGRAVANEINNLSDDKNLIVLSDCGFVDEILACLYELDCNYTAKLIQIHRNGCTFDGDSRSYIDKKDSGLSTYIINNNGTLDDLYDNLIDMYNDKIDNSKLLQTIDSCLELLSVMWNVSTDEISYRVSLKPEFNNQIYDGYDYRFNPSHTGIDFNNTGFLTGNGRIASSYIMKYNTVITFTHNDKIYKLNYWRD